MSSVVIKATVDNKATLRALNFFEKDLAPQVMAETLNRTADAVTKQIIFNIKKDFTLRGRYTLKSVELNGAKPFKGLNKAVGKEISRMFSRVGTVSPYLWKQEEGGSFESESGGAYPIATLSARTSGSYQKSIAKRNRLDPGQIIDGNIDGTNMFIGIPKGQNGKGNRGIYSRNRNNMYLVQMRNLTLDKIMIKPTHFIRDAVKKFGTAQFIQSMFNKIAVRELKKRGWNG